MRIDPSEIQGFTIEGIEQHQRASRPESGSSFIDTLQDAVKATNQAVLESDRSAVALAEGRSTNIHEAMIKMQKASISVQLLVSSTNKLIDGFKELERLR